MVKLPKLPSASTIEGLRKQPLLYEALKAIFELLGAILKKLEEIEERGYE